jgi:hypothetical protein
MVPSENKINRGSEQIRVAAELISGLRVDERSGRTVTDLDVIEL